MFNRSTPRRGVAIYLLAACLLVLPIAAVACGDEKEKTDTVTTTEPTTTDTTTEETTTTDTDTETTTTESSAAEAQQAAEGYNDALARILNRYQARVQAAVASGNINRITRSLSSIDQTVDQLQALPVPPEAENLVDETANTVDEFVNDLVEVQKALKKGDTQDASEAASDANDDFQELQQQLGDLL